MALDPIAVAARLLASTGPVTAFVEAMAVSVGAGMVLGGFVGGLLSLIFNWDAAERDRAVFTASSVVGAAMVGGLALEAILR